MKNVSIRAHMHHDSQVITRRADGTVDVATVNEEPSMTQQQYKEECDVNNIMKKYATTGEFTHVTSKQGVYGDFSDITDYQGMLDTVIRAQDAFMTLPAQVRLKFQNNPGELIAFLQDDANYDEAVSLGLIDASKSALRQNDDKPNDDKKPSAKKSKPEPEKSEE